MFKPDGRSASKRGYGKAHLEMRRQWEPVVEAGGVVCWRCRRPIVAGKILQAGRWVSNWHLGHTDDRRGWIGPEHAQCSVTAGARAGGRKGNESPKRRSPRRRRVFAPVSTSRPW